MTVRLNCRFLENKMAKSIANNPIYYGHHNDQFFPMLCLDSAVDLWWSNYSTSTLMYYLYEKAFKLSEYGYANTMGVFLAILIALISFAQFKFLGNDVEY